MRTEIEPPPVPLNPPSMEGEWWEYYGANLQKPVNITLRIEVQPLVGDQVLFGTYSV